MQNYSQKRTNLERDSQVYLSRNVIEYFKNAPSKIADIGGIGILVLGNCPSCPSCVCADFLGEEFTTAIGMAVSTPALLACKAALVCS